MSYLKQKSNIEYPYFSCILARDLKNGGIGYNDKLPWKLNEDMEYFKKITTYNSSNEGYSENIVIMGRKTFESIGKPLPNRINIIISTKLKKTEDYHVTTTLNEALLLAKTFGITKYIFVIGGVELYKEAFKHPKLETIYLTEIYFYKEKTYDVFFNEPIPQQFKFINEEYIKRDDCNITFSIYYKNINIEECQYINLIKNILNNGEERIDRTGVGTLSLFSPTELRFDLSYSFPLLTCKFVPLRVVFEELMFFIRGQTNNKILQEKNVHIWDGNSSEDYMKKIGLSHYPEGELGPIYGYQWRNFGGDYNNSNSKTIAINNGVDQLTEVINEIKTNPESRRLLVSAWNPKDLKKMVLPPCHLMYQFYVRKREYLDCKLILRSNDLFLGAPFNIASYSLLVYMVASICGYKPGNLIYSIGDAHIYKNHLTQVKEIIQRNLRPFPTLKIINKKERIEEFEYTDFKLENYYPNPKISGEMAI